MMLTLLKIITHGLLLLLCFLQSVLKPFCGTKQNKFNTFTRKWKTSKLYLGFLSQYKCLSLFMSLYNYQNETINLDRTIISYYLRFTGAKSTQQKNWRNILLWKYLCRSTDRLLWTRSCGSSGKAFPPPAVLCASLSDRFTDPPTTLVTESWCKKKKKNRLWWKSFPTTMKWQILCFFVSTDSACLSLWGITNSL